MFIAMKQQRHQVARDLVVHLVVSQSLLGIFFVDFCDHQQLFNDHYYVLCDRDGYNLSQPSSKLTLLR